MRGIVESQDQKKLFCLECITLHLAIVHMVTHSVLPLPFTQRQELEQVIGTLRLAMPFSLSPRDRTLKHTMLHPHQTGSVSLSRQETGHQNHHDSLSRHEGGNVNGGTHLYHQVAVKSDW